MASKTAGAGKGGGPAAAGKTAKGSFKDKEKPTEVRESNITAAKGTKNPVVILMLPAFFDED